MNYRLLLVLVAFFSLQQLRAQLVITEIMYNNPGTDLFEYIEVLNTGGTPIELEGYAFTSGVTFTFPAMQLGGGEFVLVAADPTAMLVNFGLDAFEFGGALNNGGETITLTDANGVIVDEVSYDDGTSFHPYADGFGSSLVLCDPTTDNSLAFNWQIASTPTGFTFNGSEIYANPGAASICSPGPIVGFTDTELSISEGAGQVDLEVILDNAGSNFTTVNVAVNGMSTVDDMDFVLNDSELTFDSGSEEPQSINISILDDEDMEGDEVLVVELTGVSNNGVILSNVVTITIVDNDVDLNNSLMLTGIFDSQPGFTGTKGIELFVINDISDLSIYGLGIANNGGGSDGKEYDFPSVSATAGSFIYIVEDSLEFADFFGFPANFFNQMFNMNGDDSVELYESGQVIDVFGDVAIDGSEEPWEYLDGWAYRVSGTGPDGNIFILENWKFGGVDALDGGMDNATSPLPFPIGTYSIVPPMFIESFDDEIFTETNTAVTINVLGNDILPGGVSSLMIFDLAMNGLAEVSGDSTITYTPDMDFCGMDGFSYIVCDANSCDTAAVTVTIACPPSFPAYGIGQVTGTDAIGLPDSLGVTCRLEGIVYGVNLGAEGLNFAIIDGMNDGIIVFNGEEDFGYTVSEGDQVIVEGEIDQFNGLTEIIADTVYQAPAITIATFEPTPVTALNESTESQLIVLEGVVFVDENQWGNGTPSGFNFDVTDGSGTFDIRIDAQVDLFNMTIPPGDPTMGTFRITGLGGQFDNASPLDDGYQLLPRYEADIEFVVSTQDPLLGSSIQVSPNPASDQVTIRLEDEVEELKIYSINGQLIESHFFVLDEMTISLQDFEKGIYMLVFSTGESTWLEKLIKE